MDKKNTHESPYNVTMHEMESSYHWLQDEYLLDNETPYRGERSEVRECRFEHHCSDGTKDSDILSKYQALFTTVIPKDLLK